MKDIDDCPAVLSDIAMNWIRALEEVQMEIIDADVSEILEEAEEYAMICDLNVSLATKVENLEDTEPVQDGPSREWAAAQQEIEELEEQLQIGKHWSAKFERWLDMFKSELETME